MGTSLFSSFATPSGAWERVKIRDPLYQYEPLRQTLHNQANYLYSVLRATGAAQVTHTVASHHV